MANAFEPGQGVPETLMAGDAWAWRADGFKAVYPATDYSLAYHLAPRNGGAAVQVAAAADQDGFLASVPAVTSASFAPGPWAWALKVTRTADGAAVTVATGAVAIQANPAAGADTRTQARRLLDAINAVLEGRAAKDVESYSIEGRALTRIPFVELRAFRARLLREVAQEEGRGRPRYSKVRFRHG